MANEEIEMLRRRVAELEAAAPAPVERAATIKEALLEHASRETPPMPARPEAAPPVPALTSSSVAAKDGVELLVDEHGPDMQKFLELLERKGLWYVLNVARQTTPHLLDDFHNVVVQYLQKHHGF